MKKRILSLILAFAMAATLAPATALVGTSVSKAASGDEQFVNVTTLAVSGTGGGFTVSSTNNATAKIDTSTGYSEVTLTNSDTNDVSVKGTMTGNNASGYIVYDEYGNDVTEGVTVPKKTTTNGTLKIYIRPLSSLDFGSDNMVLELVAGGTPGNKFTITVTTNASRPAASKVVAGDGVVDVTPDINNYVVDGPANVNGMYMNIVKSATGDFTFKMTGNSTALSSATLTGITLSNKVGSEKPNGGNLSFKIEKQSDGSYKATAVNKTKLKAGYYRLNIEATTVNGGTTSVNSDDLVSFVVSNEYKAILNLAEGNFDGSTNGWASASAGWEKWSTPNGDDTEITLPTESEVVRPGYVLTGWRSGKTYNPGATVKMTGDMTFTAIWSNEDYQITLDGGNEAYTASNSSGIETIQVKLGSPLAANPFTKTGFAFKGWTDVAGGGYVKYADKAAVTAKMLGLLRNSSDPRLYAVWEPITYTVKYDINLPSGAKASAYNVAKSNVSKKYNGRALTAAQQRNTFSVNNYTFEGWALDKDGYSTITTFDDITMNPEAKSEITLYAQWTEGYSVVVYENDYESASNSVFGVYDTTDYDGVEPKLGYTKEGFTYKDGVVASSALDFDDNGIAVLYPSYGKPDDFNAYYSTSVGTLSISTNLVNVNGGNIAFPQLKSTNGYKFMGWDLVNTSSESTTGIGYDYDKRELQRADEYNGDERFSGSYSARQIISLLYDYDDTAYANKEFSFEAVFMPLSDGAVLPPTGGTDWVKTTVGGHPFIYGTTKEYITESLRKEVKVTHEVVATGPSTPSKVTISTDKSVSSMPKTTETYKINRITVTPNYDVVGNSATYHIGAYGTGTTADIVFSIKDKTTSNPGGDVVKTITTPKTINLAKGANGFDAVDAAREPKVGQTVTFTTESSKKYNFNINDLSGKGGFTATNSDIEFYYKGTKITDKSDNDAAAAAKIKAVIDSYKFSGTIDVKYIFHTAAADNYGSMDFNADATPDAYLPDGLKSVSLKMVFTDKGYDAVSKPDETDKPEVDEIAEALKEAEKLLAEGYALRVFNPIDGNHYYYTSTSELETLLKIGCKHEVDRKSQFRASNSKTTVYDRAVYRLSTKNAGGAIHYTADAKERDNLVKLGWTWDKANYNDNGAIFYVSGNSDNAKIYRLRNGKMHHFALQNERDSLMSKNLGWVDETGSLAADMVWYTPAN